MIQYKFGRIEFSQFCKKLHKFVKNYTNLYKSTQICKKLHKFVKNYTNL
jgi:hypothetical protein